MRQIYYNFRGSIHCMFLIDSLNCTAGGTNHSLISSDDRFSFFDFLIIRASEPVYYVCSVSSFNYCTIKIDYDINAHIV